VHSATSSISSRSWRPALPVRGCCKPSKQASLPSPSLPRVIRGVESISR
jgi:hypothetical protein